MRRQTYPGINIQWPISELILSGEKTIETRTYPIPNHYLNVDMVLIETPGKKGGFKSRMRAIIRFTNCFKYPNQKTFYQDVDKHHVVRGSPWAWKEKPKYGWEIEVISIFEKPKEVYKRLGIKYTTAIRI